MGSTLTAIIAIGVLIIVHEAGHFFVARWSRMNVQKFSIGFGPAIARVVKGGTEYQIGLLPLGGFVQIEGMNPHDGSDPNSPTSYSNRPLHLRLATIFAGPAANYILGFVMLFLFFAFFAGESLAPVRVLKVLEDSAAERAGLKEGDLIVGTASAAFERADELREVIQKSAGGPIDLVVTRGTVTSTMHLVPENVAGNFQIGVELEGTGRRPHALGVAGGAKAALITIEATTMGTLRMMAMLVQLKGCDQVSGPIGMVKGVSRAAERSYADMFAFLGNISIALGIFNLLPIPALDGSRILFLILGLIRRKPIAPRVEAYVHVGGFILLIGLLIVISIADVAR